jgi:hypothetical protein
MILLSEMHNKPVIAKLSHIDAAFHSVMVNADSNGVWLMAEGIAGAVSASVVVPFPFPDPLFFVPFSGLDWIIFPSDAVTHSV